MLIFVSYRILSPSLLKEGWGFKWIRTNKSPARPPRAAFPSPRNLRLCPSSAPAGTLTCSFVLSLVSPLPPQFLHGLSTIVPDPLHLGQVVIWIICAKPDRRTCCTCPRP